MAAPHGIKGIAVATGADAISPAAATARVGIVHTEWNPTIVHALVEGATSELRRQGVSDDRITVVTVPGAFELPYAAKALMSRGTVDVIICIGCLIKGGTMHFEYISEAVSQGIMRLNVEAGGTVPVLFGVLTCLTEEQAAERAGLRPGKHNHGVEWAQSALRMAQIKATWLG